MAKQSDQRPDIKTINESGELRRWYWLKTELSAEAKRLGLKTTGGKFVILDRIGHFLDTGEKTLPSDKHESPTSRFDWGKSELTKDTLITDNYKNTQNVRRYFQTHVDPNFKFTVALIDWFRENTGKTLADAGKFWQEQKYAAAKTTIKPHNQFNQYARDFLEDNPTLGMKDARECWAQKRLLPSESGKHVYARSDLELRGVS